MKLHESIKRMLDALAYANAGENLSLRQKTKQLQGSTAVPAKIEAAALPTEVRMPQVGLYLGSNLPQDVMQYVIQTCIRLKRNLTVLTMQSDNEARDLLAPYQAELAENGIALRVAPLTGDPLVALAQALRRQPEVEFLVCNEAGYLGNGLLKGRVRKDALPVPVVLVTSEGADSPALDQKHNTSSRVA